MIFSYRNTLLINHCTNTQYILIGLVCSNIPSNGRNPDNLQRNLSKLMLNQQPQQRKYIVRTRITIHKQTHFFFRAKRFHTHHIKKKNKKRTPPTFLSSSKGEIKQIERIALSIKIQYQESTSKPTKKSWPFSQSAFSFIVKKPIYFCLWTVNWCLPLALLRAKTLLPVQEFILSLNPWVLILFVHWYFLILLNLDAIRIQY